MSSNDWALVALFAALGALSLGILISGPAAPIDVFATHLRGKAIHVALFFTWLGRGIPTTTLSLVALIVALALHREIPLAVGVVSAQILSQIASNALKKAYKRERPTEWIRIRERELSYPSGHSSTAVVLFGGLAVLMQHLGVAAPITLVLVAVFAVCVVGIMWSRMALAAHFATDVIGGALLGTAFLAAALAVVTRFPTVHSATTAALR